MDCRQASHHERVDFGCLQTFVKIGADEAGVDVLGDDGLGWERGDVGLWEDHGGVGGVKGGSDLFRVVMDVVYWESSIAKGGEGGCNVFL